MDWRRGSTVRLLGLVLITASCSCMGHFDYWAWVVGIAWVDQDHDGVWDDHEVPLPGVHFHLMEVDTENQFDHNTSASNGNAELEAHWACCMGINCQPDPHCNDLGSRLIVVASAHTGYFLTTASSQHVVADNDTLYFGFGHWNYAGN